MISGYNTDVRHGDVVFHVQTEDKGEGNPLIESLVYVGGQVLAAKRSSYAEALAEGQPMQAIAKKMEVQHRRVIAAIRSGKFAEKARQLMGGAATTTTAVAASKTAPVTETVKAEVQSADPNRTLDQVILEYLTNEADQDQLMVEVEGEPKLVSGSPAHLVLSTTSSSSGQPLEGVRFEVRMISTVAEGKILAKSRSDEAGKVAMLFEIPDLGGGTAALIITAESDLGTVELKHLL